MDENKLGLIKGGNFIGASENYSQSKAVIFGIPMDFTVSFRTGTRQGPQSIRELSDGIEDYSPYLERSLEELEYFDGGNIDLPFGNVKKSLELIEKVAQNIFNDDKFPIAIGGEHLVSYPLIKAAAKKHSNLNIIHFDAHADLRASYCNEELSHACAMRRVLDIIDSKRLYQFGIRSGTKEEFDFGKSNTSFYPFEGYDRVKEVLLNLREEPIYITLDIDVVDPSFAPGTGTPEPGGYTSKEMIEIIHLFKGKNVVGFDIVEVSPALDISLRTSLLAAKLIREGLLTFL